jgi:large subunit ribosomal protein L10
VDRAEKREFVTQLNGVFNKPVRLSWPTTPVSPLRKWATSAPRCVSRRTVKVAKNRLAKIALKGTEAEGAADLFTGQTVIAYANDPVTAPKIASEFAKSNDKLVLLGGAIGATTLDADGCQGSCRCLRSTNCAQRLSA